MRLVEFKHRVRSLDEEHEVEYFLTRRIRRAEGRINKR
jgi:TolB-like protein